MIRIKYDTQKEKVNIVNREVANNNILIEEQNITEGNFLIFGTVHEIPLIEPTELEELSNYVLDVDFRVVMLEMGL